MSLVLKINDTDRSSSIEWRTLRKSEGLTKEPDTLSFEINETTGKTVPLLGDDIKFYIDAVLQFGGTVVDTSQIIKGGILVGWKIDCKDRHHEFDKLLVAKSYEEETLRDIVIDILTNFTDGTFTYTGVPTSTPTISSIKFNYEHPSKAIQKLVDLVGWDWYVDYEKDLQIFDNQALSAPFEINDTNGKIDWETLEARRNILELKNSIIVRGGEYKTTIGESDAVDKYEADGIQRVFPLALRYDNIVVKVEGVTQTVGIDNITDPTTVDVLYNFKEKNLKWPNATKPTAADEVVAYGDAYIPLIAKIRDQISIATYGEFQDIKIDKSIISVSEAQTIGKSILRKWAEGSYEVSFITKETGLQTGQQITLNSTLRSLNKTLKITRINSRTRSSGEMEYNVFCLASGEVTFTDIMVGLLGKDRINVEITDDEVLQRLETFLENLTLIESVTTTKKSPPYTWGNGGSNDFDWNFGTWA